MIRAGVVGVSNAAASALIKILVRHPDVTLSWVSEATDATRPLAHMLPSLMGETELAVTPAHDVERQAADVLFVTTPVASGDATIVGSAIDGPSACVIDLGDYTGRAAAMACALPELMRKHIVHGCRQAACPDAALHLAALTLLPLAKHGVLGGTIAVNIDAAPNQSMTIADALHGLLATLQPGGGFDVVVCREERDCGRAVACSTVVAGHALSGVDVAGLYDDYYSDHNFTYRVDFRPEADDVMGTNKCFLSIEQSGDRLRISGALDALLKGRAGTAVHCMNLMFGLHERVGLMIG